jgi:recombination protein RecR
MPRSIQELTDLIAELPGVGPRQARRVVQYLLRADASFKKKLAERILTLNEGLSQCSVCFRFDEVNKDRACPLCADPGRDRSTVFVVEKDVDVEGIESASMYRGMYFVLGSLMPLTKQRRSALSPRVSELIAELKKRIAEVKEVVLAFATTPEGDYTARELKRTIAEAYPHLTVSFLGRGLSLGAEIEYADHETLRSAFQGRSEKL